MRTFRAVEITHEILSILFTLQYVHRNEEQSNQELIDYLGLNEE
jgi:hypothetical protein